MTNQTQTKVHAITNTKLAIATAVLGGAMLAAAAMGARSGSVCTPNRGGIILEHAQVATVCKGDVGSYQHMFEDNSEISLDVFVRGYTNDMLTLKLSNAGNIVVPVGETIVYALESDVTVDIGYVGTGRNGQASMVVEAKKEIFEPTPELQIVSHYIPNNELTMGEDVLVGSYILNPIGNEGVCLTNIDLGIQTNVSISELIQNVKIKVAGVGDIASLQPVLQNSIDLDLCLEPGDEKRVSLFADLAYVNDSVILKTSIDGYTYTGQESGEEVIESKQTLGTEFVYDGISEKEQAFWSNISLSSVPLESTLLQNGVQTIGAYVLSSTGKSVVCAHEMTVHISDNVQIDKLVLRTESQNGEPENILSIVEEFNGSDVVFPMQHCMDKQESELLKIDATISGVESDLSFYTATVFDTITFGEYGSSVEQTKAFNILPHLLQN